MVQTIAAATPDASLEDHWLTLAHHFVGKEVAIRQLLGNGTVRLTVIVDGTGRVPSILLPVDMVKFAADVGADIDVDVNQ